MKSWSSPSLRDPGTRAMRFRVASLLLASACASVPVIPATKPLLPTVKSVSPPVRPWVRQLGLAPRTWGTATQVSNPRLADPQADRLLTRASLAFDRREAG